jgi:DNA-3-methyladenine glycosylase II
MTSFTITPDTVFDLRAAASFGFGPHTGRPVPDGAELRMAFVADDLQHQVAVRLTQDPDGALQAELEGDVPAAAAEAQVRRILSLDHDGNGWLAAGQRDPVLGDLQTRFAGLRPVLFHSPYEAAAWGILAQRRHRAQAAALRRRLAEAHGAQFTPDGAEPLAAFPTPAQLLEVRAFGGLDPVRISRLHAIADAALAGQLDPGRLAALEPDAALADIQTLPGLGPTYGGLVLLRAVGVTDVLTRAEPRLPYYAAHYYQAGHVPLTGAELAALAEPWRPYRTWAAVLLRVAGDRDGLPAGDRTSA